MMIDKERGGIKLFPHKSLGFLSERVINVTR